MSVTMPCKRTLAEEKQTREAKKKSPNGRIMLVPLLDMELEERSDAYDVGRSSDSQRKIGRQQLLLEHPGGNPHPQS